MTEKGEQGMVNRFPSGRLRGKGCEKNTRSFQQCSLVLIPGSPSLAGQLAETNWRLGGTRDERSKFKVAEPTWYVYENKGKLRKTCVRSQNVYENKGSYPLDPGMLLKMHELMIDSAKQRQPSTTICPCLPAGS